MIKQVVDQDELQRYVDAVRVQIGAQQLAGAAERAAATFDGTGDPVAKLRGALPQVDAGLASSGGKAASAPFMSRDPIQSLLQSTLEGKLREQGVKPEEQSEHRGLLGWLVHLLKSILHPVRFGPDDPKWVIDVAEAVLEHLAKGNHPFNPLPAEHEIGEDARVVIVGDWGTGLPRAQAVAKFMAEEVAQALAEGREVHVVHLGDVYYSGLKAEVLRHVLAPGMWPVTVEQARAGVTSWSLNGNHDMYGGGFGYFDTLLGDERFSKQRSPEGKSTSFFRLRSPSWDFVGLDTSWDPEVLSEGFVGVLEDPQADFVKRVAEESRRKLMLLSHHQLVSVYDSEDIGKTLPTKLASVLGSGRVTAWLWGHEHRCMGFDQAGGVKVPRCIGHGGVPVLMGHAPNEPIP
ncbi:MAG TPA: metallophosphoesterase, partial [Solirubrobacteraceae bacterium]|nr:metallophosphoesterase [Solirubrobacteraceae bacterium]